MANHTSKAACLWSRDHFNFGILSYLWNGEARHFKFGMRVENGHVTGVTVFYL